MVAATGAVMSVMTPNPAAANANATGAANAADNVPAAAGDFVQMIAQLLGDATPGNATAATSAVTDQAAGQADQDDKDTKSDPLTDMLALTPFAYAAPPQAPVNGAPTATSEADEAVESMAPATGGAGDAMRLRQLSKLLEQNGVSNDDDATASSSTDAPLSSLFAKPETTLPAIVERAAEFSLKPSNDDQAAGMKPVAHSATAFDQLQQANALQARVIESGNDARPQFTLHSRVGSPEWSAELGNKLSLMTTQHTQSASLQLTPENLGPVEVKIEVKQGQASVWFTADQADTRTALEQSLPKLRELFASQGMSLTDAGVFGQRSQQQQQSAFLGGNGGSHSSDELTIEAVPQRSLSLGLLDMYA